jgi:hypothetical protein
MSDLTPLEKRKLEKFLGMETGYVLDFTNRTFAEFISHSTGRNILDERYNQASGSKAHRMRAFWQKEDNATVGKLIQDILDYSENTGAEAQVCRLIAARLLPSANQHSQSNSSHDDQLTQQQRRAQALRELKDAFFQLAADTDRSRAGLTLEKLLNRLFALFDLAPRQPFRVIGEQIDGSFQLDGHVYLLESKWEKNPLPEAPLLVFRGKIEGKSTFTRGVMIALNDISAPAREAITRGKSPSFFVMNGHDLIMILSEAMTLTDFLRQRVRLLAEEGRMCVHISELK